MKFGMSVVRTKISHSSKSPAKKAMGSRIFLRFDGKCASRAQLLLPESEKISGTFRWTAFQRPCYGSYVITSALRSES